MSSTLVVSLISFSYKNGIPVGDPEHGGGFVFDCRCLPNPGREAQFKHLSGKDEDVRRYMESALEVQTFKEHVFNIIDQAVNTYTKRGFNTLTVAFGCTGGQHRSVYFVESIAEHLKKRGVAFIITHRDESMWP